jgi:hypothetical protein
MPSFLRHSRSYSFPPSFDNVEFATSRDAELPDIDEEPFAHFLAPVEEEDDPYDPLVLGAGIVTEGPRASKASKFKSNIADKWARYIKHNQPQLHDRYHDELNDDESFMTLDDDRLLDTPHSISHLSSSPPPRIVIHEPTRGRAQELVSRKARPRHRTSRTLSGHRHSWREPSPDLFTVEESESEEDALPVLRRSKTKKTKDGVDRRRSRTGVVERARL